MLFEHIYEDVVWTHLRGVIILFTRCCNLINDYNWSVSQSNRSTSVSNLDQASPSHLHKVIREFCRLLDLAVLTFNTQKETLWYYMTVQIILHIHRLISFFIARAQNHWILQVYQRVRKSWSNTHFDRCHWCSHLVSAQQEHNVETTSIKRWLNVLKLNQR